METIFSPITSLDQLQQLPAFARFLRDSRFDAYLAELLRFSQLLQVPLLQVLEQLPEEARKKFLKESTYEFLTYLAENKAAKQIEEGVLRWKENRMPQIEKSSVSSSDITLVNHSRKQAMLQFAPEFCATTGQLLQLVQEIDFFSMKSEDASFSTYIDLLMQKIEDQSYLTSKITNTSPGIIYLFSLRPYSVLYANKTAETFFGFSNKELVTMGAQVFDRLIHPDDLPATFNFLREVSQTRDSEVRTIEFRMKPKSGEYVWMRNYFSVFKRDGDGMPTEIIGNILNIQAEKEAIDKLQESEKRYRQAEALTHIGHYDWSPQTGLVQGSEELYRIYGLDPKHPPLTSQKIFEFTHPDDFEWLKDNMLRAFEKGTPYSFHFRISTADGTQKIVQSRGEVYLNAEGKPEKVTGTLQDVTERQTLIQRLRHSEQMYQQAERLAHLGNFSLDLATNEVEASEEVSRIYGVAPTSHKWVFDQFLSFIHPEDREQVQRLIAEAISSHEPRETIHRIIRPDASIRYVYLVGYTQSDEQGRALRVVGSAQDITERQLLIEQLQESQKLYEQAQALARLGNWSIDLEGGKVTWSREMFQIYELQDHTPLSMESWEAFIHPEDADEVNAYFQHCVQHRLPYDKIHRVVLQNGKIKTLHRRAEIIFNEAGKAIRAVGTTQDVTEQQRVQQELKENQTFIRKITDATPSIIASYNLNTGQYTFISEGIRKLLGYDPKQVLEDGILFFERILHPDDLAELAAKNTAALAEANTHPENNDMVIEFTYRLRHREGHYRWFHTYGTIFDRNAAGQVEHILNISLDVTEQKEASQKIEEQEQFIQNIADASPTILYVYDVPGSHFAYVNQEIYFVLGYTPEEVVEMGTGVTDLLYHPDDYALLPERAQSNRRISQSDVMIQYECRLRHKSGEWLWFLVREVVFRTDESDRPLQIVGAALDISRRKEMEKTLLQNSFMLQQSNASLEEFAYVASHDLKEPLRKISTFGDRLAATQAEKLSPEGKVFLSKIIDASQRMQTMISDLLSISMISGNRQYEPYSLQKVLDETLQTLEAKIEQKAALVTSDGLPQASIVVSQFRQLFQNLISNSLKFVTEGVQPHIRISHTYLQPEQVTAYQLTPAPRYLKVELSDNGIGFEKENAGKIFLLFQRLHGRSEYEGSGIGLAICKKIVEHHGGVIYAQSEPGHGATFTIILPAEGAEI